MVDVKFNVVVDGKDFCAEMLRIACDVGEHDVVRCTAINALTKLANVSLVKELELNYSVDTERRVLHAIGQELDEVVGVVDRIVKLIEVDQRG